MNKYKIEVKQNTFFIPDVCFFCGCVFEPSDVIMTLYQDGKRQGDICPDCNSPKAAADRARTHAAQLKEETERLLENAETLDTMPADIFPTAKQIEQIIF